MAQGQIEEEMKIESEENQPWRINTSNILVHLTQLFQEINYPKSKDLFGLGPY